MGNVDPMKYKYTVYLQASNGNTYNITDYVESLSWEDNDGELASKISAELKNEKTTSGWIHKLAQIGCKVIIKYSYDSGNQTEAVRGKIVEWNPSSGGGGRTFRIKAYDMLYDFQESSDNVYFSKGKKTKQIIKKLFGKWGIPLGEYTGANVTHGKEIHRNKALGSFVFDILKEAKHRGGAESIPRAVKNKVSILAVGTNKTVYKFSETRDIVELSHTISTVGMVTRVRIIGQEKKKSKKTPVYATVNGKTKYGIRQKMYSRSNKESLKTAKKEAKQILKDEGSPKNELRITAFDVPPVRKGDTIHLTSATYTGYCIVKSVTHNCEDHKMKMVVKKTS